MTDTETFLGIMTICVVLVTLSYFGFFRLILNILFGILEIVFETDWVAELIFIVPYILVVSLFFIVFGTLEFIFAIAIVTTVFLVWLIYYIKNHEHKLGILKMLGALFLIFFISYLVSRI